MFNSTFTEMIDKAINDCITYGSGRETRSLNTGNHVSAVSVRVDWGSDEESVEVNIYENQVLRFTYFEQLPEKYR